MNIFDIHSQIIGEYKDFVKGFINIKDEKIQAKVDEELEGGKLWPDPLIQFNPSYKTGATVKSLCDEGMLHPELNNIFTGYELYKHQVQALKLGTADKGFIVTSGTGSGKSLTYLGTIFNYILSNPSQTGIKAIIVYPMNALINSQFEEIKKYKKNYEERTNKSFPITFGRYTGQEGQEERTRIKEDQPHILLTNYMMMELILTRNSERVLRKRFQDTIKYLVFDELHTYRGRQGSDVAMQIRRIQNHAKNKLICIGTSATMASGETSLEERRISIAEVGSKIFGADYTKEDIIDEEFELSFNPLPQNNPEKVSRLKEALEKDIDASAGESKLKMHPLGSWLESDIGLVERENKLVRREPRTLPEIVGELAALTSTSEKRVQNQLKVLLEWAERINVENKEKGERQTWLPYKLHQFLLQTGSVHVTMKPPKERDSEEDIQLDAGYYLQKDEGETIPLFPIVFSRISGHEFLCVQMADSKTRLLPRMFDEHTTEEDEEQDRLSGYILFDHENSVWGNEYLSELPASWFKKSGELKKSHENKVPKPIWVDEQGNFSFDNTDGYQRAWFIQSPLPFDPTSGIFFSGNTNEYTKLTKLGSEARSTATSVISQATINKLRETGTELSASKVLSFTDVRQDASLQSGHFNDFTKTIKLRSSIFQSLKDADEGFLDHTTIAQKVFDVLKLHESEFAKDPISEEGFSPVVNKNEEALKKKLFYDILYDLKLGWRVTMPNLEQCGLLDIEYPHLMDYCEDESGWQSIPGFKELDPEKRYELVFRILEYFRKQYAIDHESLSNNSIERNEKEIRERLKSNWGFDQDERIHRPNWMRFSPLTRKPGGLSLTSIGLRSKLGQYLKADQDLQPYVDSKDNYEQTISSLLDAFRGIYFVCQEIPDRGTGEKVPIYRLKIDSMVWKAGDGSSASADPVNYRSYKSFENNLNTYFRDLYSDTTNNDSHLKSAEHTGQISNEDRIDREEKFRSGELNALFCSPTMELGIDIADLNVVHMRNVPPNPANYAQRSGRAGRSGQAALVFTYCANYSPHDRHYFKKSKNMVAGEVLPPRLDLSNEELLTAHLNAMYLSKVGINDLEDSVANVLDFTNEQELLLKPEVREKFKLNAEQRDEIKRAFRGVIDDIVPDMDWYSEDWLEETVNHVPQAFDDSLDRWRTLYHDARQQRIRAQRVLDDPTYKSNSREKKQASIEERQARWQIHLLKNENTKFTLSEFYPFRYLASEGFLPGYNFTRLPIRAFMPSDHVSREGDYLSRPRRIALREFGPRNVVYHNGSKYTVTRMNVSDLSNKLTKAKISKKSGYILDESSFNKEVCPFTGTRLDNDDNREIIMDLVEMGEVRTISRQRISCDEEERASRGYEIDTYFKVDGSLDRVTNISLRGSADELMKMRYIPAAKLYFVNRKWRISSNKGFLIDLTTGEWSRSQDLDRAAEKEDDVSEHKLVQLYVTDTADALYLHPTRALGINRDGVITLQYALKNAIVKQFQVEPNEIRVELMGSDTESPNILLYEAAEGSLGVLKQLAEEPEKFAEVINLANAICYFDLPEEEEKKIDPATYDDLLSYYNQWYHQNIDRRLIKSALQILMEAEAVPLQKGSNRSYEEQYQYLLERIDPNSELEEKFLNYLYENGIRLPDEAQFTQGDYYVLPDFFYEPNICIFIDGSVHDKPGVKEDDEIKRRVLRKGGYQVLSYHYTGAFDSFVKDRPDIFKKVKVNK
ncbi:MAG: DEAD/DEAH box helicase [Candidatus Marinimicrobia bacterium]|nr:DEAD/DEAH box helicase [Candidatus Neomarinimicrobiota bacterium]MCF7829350.1 DEAD/DEAH box helicase [Candidatus Neomarinimicrobiota bacterium]MCF7879987.1 DEAD/DEAH box helicase [Candidatus Neomarinimicrobiota bacterium]